RAYFIPPLEQPYNHASARRGDWQCLLSFQVDRVLWTMGENAVALTNARPADESSVDGRKKKAGGCPPALSCIDDYLSTSWVLSDPADRQALPGRSRSCSAFRPSA